MVVQWLVLEKVVAKGSGPPPEPGPGPGFLLLTGAFPATCLLRIQSFIKAATDNLGYIKC